MSGETDAKVPPYPSFKTFDNFINSLVETGVPGQIDNSLLRNLSGSAQSSLLGALRFLNLVSEDKAPTTRLHRLAVSESAARAGALKEAVEVSYPFLAAQTLDLTRATPQQLADSLRGLGASGGTLEKAIAFFLAAAQAAGILISPHILKRKHGGNPAPAKNKPRVAKAKSIVGGALGGEGRGQDGNPFQRRKPRLIEALYESLPSDGESWTVDDAIFWLQTAAANFRYAYRLPGTVKVTVELQASAGPPGG